MPYFNITTQQQSTINTELKFITSMERHLHDLLDNRFPLLLESCAEPNTLISRFNQYYNQNSEWQFGKLHAIYAGYIFQYELFQVSPCLLSNHPSFLAHSN